MTLDPKVPSGPLADKWDRHRFESKLVNPANRRRHTVIVVGTGLAGGSADAAATLLGLNQLWQLGLSPSELATLSAEIGSDIPFFFHLPAAWCTGRGEMVSTEPLPRPLDIVLLCPVFKGHEIR